MIKILGSDLTTPFPVTNLELGSDFVASSCKFFLNDPKVAVGRDHLFLVYFCEVICLISVLRGDVCLLPRLKPLKVVFVEIGMISIIVKV